MAVLRAACWCPNHQYHRAGIARQWDSITISTIKLCMRRTQTCALPSPLALKIFSACVKIALTPLSDRYGFARTVFVTRQVNISYTAWVWSQNTSVKTNEIALEVKIKRQWNLITPRVNHNEEDYRVTSISDQHFSVLCGETHRHTHWQTPLKQCLLHTAKVAHSVNTKTESEVPTVAGQKTLVPV